MKLVAGESERESPLDYGGQCLLTILWYGSQYACLQLYGMVDMPAYNSMVWRICLATILWYG